MQTRLAGTTMPILEITLGLGERIIAEGEDVSWLTAGFQLETSTRFGSGGRGGFMSGLKRCPTGHRPRTTTESRGRSRSARRVAAVDDELTSGDPLLVT